MKKLALILILFSAQFAFASEAELKEQIQKLKEQGEAQAAQLQQLQTQTHSLLEQKAPSTSDTTVSGYGEINYNDYSRDNSRNQMDLRRFVFFLGHRFDDKWSFNSEVEWEHAVTSAEDKGESEIEQAYLTYSISQNLNMRMGLILMPFGFLNENHEPPVFYGVERNDVETRIIPSTWREGGIGLYGNSDLGVDWSAGLVTDFDIAKFDDAGYPLAAVHQELQLAKAEDLAVFAAVNYRMPGFMIGTGVFSGNSTQGNADYNADNTKPSFAGINSRITLADVMTRWQQHGWDLEALYAKGFIGDSSDINDAIQTYNTAHPSATPRVFVPAEFYGWLLQAAYTFSVGPKATLSPFARYEYFNTQSNMSDDLPSDPANRDYVTTAGLSFHPIQEIVFKTDYQWYTYNTVNNRFNLGMGYMF